MYIESNSFLLHFISVEFFRSLRSQFVYKRCVFAFEYNMYIQYMSCHRMGEINILIAYVKYAVIITQMIYH